MTGLWLQIAPGDSNVGFTPYTIQGREVHYSRKTSTPGDIAFIDRGRRIEIQDWRNRESVLAALQLSHEKWGSITVTGNEQYKTMCAELAAEHRFNIVIPELQAAIGALRQERTAEQRMKEKEIERSHSQAPILQKTIPRLRKRLKLNFREKL